MFRRLWSASLLLWSVLRYPCSTLSDGCQPFSRQSSQTGTVVRRWVRSIRTPWIRSVDTILPHAAHCAVRVLFSFAFSLGMRGGRGALLFGFDDDGDLRIYADPEVDRDDVLADGLDRFFEADAPALYREAEVRQRLLDVDVGDGTEELAFLAGARLHRQAQVVELLRHGLRLAAVALALIGG